MGKIGRSWGTGLASGAFGLALIATLGAPWPVDGVEAAARVPGARAASTGVAGAKAGFALRCRQAGDDPQPGFVLLGTDAVSSASQRAERAGIACRLHSVAG